jgi:hypothetical protein
MRSLDLACFKFGKFMVSNGVNKRGIGRANVVLKRGMHALFRIYRAIVSLWIYMSEEARIGLHTTPQSN